ncbi:MAG: hypothetical protein ACRC5A_03995, partial [Enterobacteriaceae bacterium]
FSDNKDNCAFLLSLVQQQADFDDYVIENKNFFIQLIVNSLSCPDEAVRQQAQALYNRYLQLPAVKSYIQASLILFGDLEGNTAWQDPEANNIILISGEQSLLVSQKQFNKMRHGDEDTVWTQCYLYQLNNGKPEYESPTRPVALFRQFPLFLDRYLAVQNRVRFPRLLKLLNLGEEYSTLFREELTRRRQTAGDLHKLTDSESGKKLAAIFAPVLDRRGATDKDIRLTGEHLTAIFTLYELTQAGDLEKAQTLLSLAAVFARYSASAHFGTETASPDTLRFYAWALLHEAMLLDSQQGMMTEAQCNKWRDKLLGIDDAFTCTAILSDAMIAHAKEKCPHIINSILPPAWG